ncbi:MAG: AAA family ATPase [Candidatus Paracaedibacteraceae bacterium]|nr:AAA family ATPase [Candidatus Paracaedibacteraceae bacterium]
MSTFIGRSLDLQKLNDISQRKKANLIVIKGRRRIGKSTLATEFAKDKRFISLTGLAPESGLTDQNQRDNFARQLTNQLKLPAITFNDWTDAFFYVSSLLDDQKTVILLDEISWMGSNDPSFIPKLKAWWDLDIQNRANINIILCGSVSTWIEDNIINSTSLFGRISLILELNPLSLSESAQLLRARNIKGTTRDIIKILSITGGIPWYIEQFLPHYTADENIKKLCFEANGLLTTEFDKIFHDLFGHRGEIYRAILRTLEGGMKSLNDIRTILNYPKSGTLSKVMDHLITGGFVSKHDQWSIKTKDKKRQSLYRVKDPYTRFYLKYIQPNIDRIKSNAFLDAPLTQLPGYQTVLGFQVECLLLQNRQILIKQLGINSSDILFDNPYSQKASTRAKGCQIDYLIQTRSNHLYVCEFKAGQKDISTDITDEVQTKIDRLSIPKGYATIPVLIHIGNIPDSVIDSNYFFRIIDIETLIQAD